MQFNLHLNKLDTQHRCVIIAHKFERDRVVLRDKGREQLELRDLI